MTNKKNGQINEYTDFDTRLSFLNSFVIGKMRYMLPLYTNAGTENITKLHRVLMSAARAAIGSYCCCSSISQILNKCRLKINILICIELLHLHVFIKFIKRR